MPVSWQTARWPSAHRRELVRIWAMASLAVADCSRSWRATARGCSQQGGNRNELQRVGDALHEVVRRMTLIGVFYS